MRSHLEHGWSLRGQNARTRLAWSLRAKSRGRWGLAGLAPYPRDAGSKELLTCPQFENPVRLLIGLML